MKKLVSLLLMAICLVFTAPVMAPAAAKPAQATVVAALNVNVATAKELQSLPGIGEVTAARIIDYRKTNGKFVSLEDMMKVKGIGTKTLEKIRKRIVIE